VNISPISDAPSFSAPPTICVVTVTYGQRVGLLSAVVDALASMELAQQVVELIIVDNGSHATTKQYLAQLCARDARVKIVDLPENLGSAKGFSAGLRAAANGQANFVWMLDDDNRPEPGALRQLLLAVEKCDENSAFMSLRTDREHLVRYAAGEAKENCFPRPNTFSGFSLLGSIVKNGRRLLRSSPPAPMHTPGEIREIPVAEYGGFFFRRRMLDRVGFPREDFILYGDDHEFTLRFTTHKAPIYLVPKSELIDIERSWNAQPRRSSTYFFLPFIPLKCGPDMKKRMYYTVRNRVYMETHALRENLPMYCLNSAALLTIMALLSSVAVLLHRSFEPFRGPAVVFRAVMDGIRGRLGVCRAV
jgi:GT2 family glycosyltransferase